MKSWQYSVEALYYYYDKAQWHNVLNRIENKFEGKIKARFNGIAGWHNLIDSLKKWIAKKSFIVFDSF